ncbi:peptidase dimerization domain-containing protein [Sulfodiicoccus acidiphilus]|uniref:peptidase dimerization domain-containing protein n=1 Tax=Sulfodiicoccus acidiphilus TaxID=1670455 RepID=UPI000F8328A7|nr:peptidase dimerization domain-containing protein [Sulfodiicoccus acidiphilus]
MKYVLLPRETEGGALFGKPTRTIDNMVSGYVGEGSKTVVPHRASVKLAFRLVPNQDPCNMSKSLKDYLEGRRFPAKLSEMGLEYSVRTPPNTTLVRALFLSTERIYTSRPFMVSNSAWT